MTTSSLLDAPSSIADPVEPEIESVLPKVKLIDSDGVPMESDWHVRETALLLHSLDHHFRGRDDCYYAGNMFLYYSEEQARNRDFRGPDFFFVSDTHREPRRPYWALWLENNRTPDVVIELSSPSTVANDYGDKKRIYERVLRVPDYFCYDPLTQRLDGWRLEGHRYRALPHNEQGRLWSEELKLWVGPWQGFMDRGEETWLRFFDVEGNLILLSAEAERKIAEQQHQRADGETKRADEEKSLRLAAEAELAQLRERLALLEKRPTS